MTTSVTLTIRGTHVLRAIALAGISLSTVVVSDESKAQSLVGPTDAAPSPAPQDAASSTQLQDIVVTAQRREQNLQDVPVSVTAFNADTLARRGISNVQQLTQVDPSLNLGQSTGVVFPFIRGVGNPTASSIGNESSVPVYIDDVYYTRLSRVLLELGNVERVEVLKGPQGTLFGRNASGGALQFFTRDPRDRAFQMKLGYGNFETATGQLYVSQPLGEGNGIDLSVSGRLMNKGWGRNITTGDPTNRYNFFNARSKLLLSPTDTTTIRLIGYYYRSFAEEGNTAGVFPGTFQGTSPFYGPSQRIPALTNIYDSRSTFTPFNRNEGYGGSLKIDQKVGFAQITSITAFRRAKEQNVQDGENLPQNFQTFDLNPRDKQFSQEFQLKSLPASRISWIVGGFYLYSRQGFDPIIVTGDSVPPGSQLDISGIQTIKSEAIFGQTTFPLGSTTNVTLGARYTWDKVRGQSRGTFLTFPAVPTTIPLGPSYDQTVNFEKFTYRVAVDQKIANRVKVYASVSRGYKSGTFNTLPVNRKPADPETVDAYEIGLKSEFFDRRVRLNGAVFWNDIANPQVQAAITDPLTGVSALGLTNAQAARTQGFEANLDFAAAKGLTLQFGATYTRGKYRRFKGAPAFYAIENGACPRNATAADPLGVAAAAGYVGGLCPVVFIDASGKSMLQVPKWRMTGGLTYDIDLGGTHATFDVSAAYTSRIFFDPQNDTQQSPRTLINSSLVFAPDDQVNIRFWVNNLTNERYILNYLPVALGAGRYQTPGAPRTFGVEVGFKL